MNSLRDSFNKIVQEHGPSVYRVCRAYLGHTDELDDLYQEVLINVWRSMASFRGESQLGTWIYRVAVNTAITYRRKVIRGEAQSAQLQHEPALEYDDADREDKIMRDQQYQQLILAIEKLKPEQRIIIGLYLEDMSYKDIAQVLGKDTNYVGVNLTRIKTKLTKLLK